MRRLAIVSVVSILLLASCASGAATTSGGATLSGVVLAGPACPVERPESPCPPKPWSGTVRATGSDGSTYDTTAASDGRFAFTGLPDGSYTLVAVTSGGPPTGIPQQVDVPMRAQHTITLQVDTGIR
ncbi:MAG: carboxypeptidase-like regulatory domain-containing protein [Actinomycetota bacterium]